MDADGSNKTRMTNNSYRDADAIFSPDGTKLLVTHYQGAPSSDCCNETDLYIMDIATKAENKLYGTSVYEWGADWKNAGILFTIQNGGIARINPDGTGFATVLNSSKQAGIAIYSPSGDKLFIHFKSFRLL